MRRQRRLKKIKLPISLEGLREHIFRRVVNALVLFLFLIVSFFLVKAFLYRSDYFRLRGIETKDAVTGQRIGSFNNSELLKIYNNKNIFAINIEGIAKSLGASYPDAKTIVIKRVLPDKLVIDFNFRTPVALIRDMRYYLVDYESFVLTSLDIEKFRTLPVITGIDVKNVERRGKKVESVNLKVALGLLREMRSSKFPIEYNVDTIDAGDINNLSFYLKNGLEIKIGCEDFKERLEVLKKTLRDPRLVIDKIRYIDVRFKDVVIGPK